MDAPVTRWWWVRHAPIAPPNAGRINGCSDVDVALDAADRRWRALAGRLPADALWLVSNLSRTTKTAAAIFAAGLREKPLAVEADLAEQDFGAWTGRTWTDIDADRDAGARQFWLDPAHARPPGGESFAEQVARTGAVMARISAEAAGHDVVAVAHAGTIRAALAVALDIDPAAAMAFKIDTLSLTRTDHIAGHKAGWRGGAWAVVQVNWTPAEEDAP